ncbi:hypothetical protein BGZ65_011311 [Modicella reniformis]|uniref:Uncharacterized protein n=1 Tax=Modicella reniformis TaxID=1440133 RepID=A0A9P6IM98_9FUNG|nr:hypothetical protein BGZ65_011311 [Modicella reniformis]
MTGGSSKSDHSSKMPLQQTVTYSGASASSSQPSPIESKAKTPGFIRALSSKLRSKPSDDQLKAVKINNQVVGTPAVPPSVSIEPPRLELTFMGDSLRSAELGPDAGPEKGSQLPMTAVPAWMTHPDSGANAPERWRRESLPILNSSNNGGTVSENQDLRPKGFMGLRRASAAVFGSGNNSLREQQPKSKNGSPPMTRPLLTKNDDDSSYRAPLPSSKHQEVEQQETSLPTDLSVPTQGSSPSSGTGSSILKKATVVENEIHFSTATVLKDGKLYYQADPWKQQTEAAATAILMRKQCISNSQFMASIAAADSCSHSLDLPGQQLGQATRNRTANAAIEITNQDQEPSPAQMAAAMNVARESFMVLTSDPTTLATFMEMSATRPGQPVIMNSGTFTKGSVVPRMNSPSQPRMNTSKKIPNQQSKQKQQQLYPSLNRNPNNRLKPTRSVPMASMNGDEPDNAQRNIYDKSLPISSTTVKTASLTDFQTTKQPGLVAIGGGGAGFSASLSPAPQRLHKRSDSTSSSIVAAGGVTKGKKDKGFFGKRLTKGAKSSNSGRKRRLLPLGVRRQDVMTKTVESMDEVFPWTCTEHMAGDESEWVMLEPANNGAVGWVVVDMLEDDVFGGDAQ